MIDWHLGEHDVTIVTEHTQHPVAEKTVVVPIADRGAAALAVGMALAGTPTVLELSSTARLAAVLEPLAEAAKVSRDGAFQISLVVRVPYGTEGGLLDAPLGWLTGMGIPTVVARPETAAALFEGALSHDGPVVMLEPRSLGQRKADPVSASLAQARLLRTGDHLTLAAWGADLTLALDAAELLSARGIEATVIDLVSLSPLDEQTLGAAVQRTGRLVVVHPEDPDLAQRICRVGLGASFLYLESPLETVASHDPNEIARVAEASVNY